MKIYTKTGDDGTTSLFGGKRLPKFADRIESYGTVDELNAFIGLLRDGLDDDRIREVLHEIQNCLFNMGSVLATDPGSGFELPGIEKEDIDLLEGEIDAMQSKLAPLKNFILPGGLPSVSYAHICRTVCRRAERRVVGLAQNEDIDALIINYLNRLSDYFFVLGRYIAVLNGVEEVKWQSKSR